MATEINLKNRVRKLKTTEKYKQLNFWRVSQMGITLIKMNYCVDFERLKNKNDYLDWKYHLLNKTWMSDLIMQEFEEILIDLNIIEPQWIFLEPKYTKSLANIDSSTVKITGKNGDKYVNMKTLEVEILVNNDGELMLQMPSNLKKGQYKATLIVEVPRQDN